MKFYKKKWMYIAKQWLKQQNIATQLPGENTGKWELIQNKQDRF
jgi:hypothetical protein